MKSEVELENASVNLASKLPYKPEDVRKVLDALDGNYRATKDTCEAAARAGLGLAVILERIEAVKKKAKK